MFKKKDKNYTFSDIEKNPSEFIVPIIWGKKVDDIGIIGELYSDNYLDVINDGSLFDLIDSCELKNMGEMHNEKRNVFKSIKFHREMFKSYDRFVGFSCTFSIDKLSLYCVFRQRIYLSSQDEMTCFWLINGQKINVEEMLPHTKMKAELLYKILGDVGENMLKRIEYIRSARDCYSTTARHFIVNYAQID